MKDYVQQEKMYNMHLLVKVMKLHNKYIMNLIR